MGETRVDLLHLLEDLADAYPGDLDETILSEIVANSLDSGATRAHPAYRRAAASRAEGYHLALTVALALASVAAEPAHQHAFVTAFLSRWGESVSSPRTHRRGGR